MDVKIVVALFVVGLIAKGHAQLSCYVCENCPDGNNLPEEFLVPCSGEETTTASAITTTTSPSTEPSDETTTPTSPTTEITTNPTDTTTNPTDTTTNPTDTTTVESTDPPTTVDTEPTTPPPDASTTPEIAATTQSTVEQPPSFSTPTTPDRPIIITSPDPVTEGTTTPTDITTATIPSSPFTITAQPTVTAMLASTSLQRQTSVKQTDYNCYVLVNTTNHVNRGCVAASKYPNNMCRVANALVLPMDCRVCDTDKCNSSSRIVLSVFLLVFSIGTILGL